MTADRKKVFVVYGRNKLVRRQIFAFLKLLGLSPIAWEEAVWATQRMAPYNKQIIDTLLSQAQAVVVLLTGDDEVRLQQELASRDELAENSRLQPRLNVIFEAGMAFSNPWLADKTILVEIGDIDICKSLQGRHRIKLSNNIADRWNLFRSLKEAGCEVETPDLDKLRRIGDFNFTEMMLYQMEAEQG
ncbi:MAG TPA: TIR domain-containing protein [Ktedonobacteraceae bacterium]|jgi:predicted nucleotide-binding protein|nr:TIR domain-containing protein [Ktedonobacteraceae bacterium]